MEQILLSSESLVRVGSDTLTIVPSRDNDPASRPQRDVFLLHFDSTVTRVFIKGKYVADIFYASSDIDGFGFRWFIDARIPFAINGTTNLGNYRSRRDAENAVLDAWTAKLRKDGAA